tara:strand:+ start:6287 stop:7018 length:732 start_codon:yes stop_codon:yes gene_type:complete
MKTYLQHKGLQVLPHRGGAEESFENTIESFDYSRSIGCKFIETDVQTSSDGVPYIFHDDDLSRILNKHIVFSELSSKEIDNLHIFKNKKIPRLDETLEKFPNLSFQIDFKTDEVVKPALDVINKLDVSDRVCIASFSSKRLELVRSINPNLCISMGPNEVFKTLIASWGLYKKSLIGDCLQVPISYYGIRLVSKRFVDFVHTKNLKIMVWTINDVKTFEYLIGINVDGIITDRPKLLFDTLNN